MQNKINTILSLVVLVFFIPATLGFALINHQCSGCHSHNTETSFLIMVHNHDNDTCFCTESANAEEPPGCDQHEDSCQDKDTPVQHEHSCVVDLKKLEEPFTPISLEKWLPTPLSITITAVFFAEHQISPESFLEETNCLAFSPPRVLTGYERLIKNEVFRL